MNTLRRALRIVDGINLWAGRLTKYLIAALMLLMVYEVITRYVLNSPSIWALESSQFLFCGVIALSGGWALLRGKHVNVGILRDRLGIRPGAVLDVAATPLFFLFVIAFLGQSLIPMVKGFADLEKSGTYWNPPIYPIYAVIFVGAVLILLQGIAQTVRSITTAVTGKAGKELLDRIE